jgi:ABC-type sugar transport system ATPase subunit
MPLLDAPPRPVLALDSVTMTFGDLAALKGVSLELAPGQIHALLGANGSGKSTLVKVMSGVYQPDGGSLTFDGTRLASFKSPADAASRGVRVVHQEAPLIDTTSVAEAVAIFRGFGVSGLGAIRWRRLRRQVQDLLDRMDVPVRADDPCSSLKPADRAGLALAIVVGDLFDQAPQPDRSPAVRLLIVDEVTASIHDAETGRHLERLRRIADLGVAVVMVTHRLGELEVADDVTVLRDGAVVYRQAGGPRLSTAELVSEMVGTAVSHRVDAPAPAAPSVPAGNLSQVWEAARPRARKDRGSGGPAIEVRNLRGGELRDCSFRAAAREVVGFAGLRGSGVDDLPRMLAGDVAWTAGSVTLDGRPVRHPGRPDRMLDAGLTTLAADRLRDGGVPTLSVQENLVLPALSRYWHRAALHRKVTRSVIDAFDVHPPSPDATFGGLSGGNQQKVLLGKWLLLDPSVLVLADPTYGVDPGAREAIFAAVGEAAARGVCVLFFSTEPEQLVRTCSRVLVLREGAIVTELTGSEVTMEKVTEWSEK